MPAQAIRPHPENPHYFLFRGKPIVLVTSAEHYGALINLDFNYMPYLDALAAYGLNYTRIYMGAYLEPEHYFIRDNPLGPRLGRHCLPWARSETPGYPLGGSLFDLDRWNAEYFARLKDFVAVAGARGIVVEICFFNAMYPDTWERMPLYHANNIQQVTRHACKDFQTLKDPLLVHYQEAYVRKITRELNSYDNVIFEICDEPGIHGTQPADYMPWLRRLAALVHESERDLPHKHMVAQQICGVLGGYGDVTADADVDLIVSQYVGPNDGAQFGGMQLLSTEYTHEKPIELNETAYYPIWYKDDPLADTRVEAWEFMIGGGSAYNHLNGLYTPQDSGATKTHNAQVLQIFKNLMEFIYSFDFLRMRRAPDLIAGGLPPGTFARGMSEPGKQYALYLHHSENLNVSYRAIPGDYQEDLALNLAVGDYTLEWVDPATLAVIRSASLTHPGGVASLATPSYSIDLALRIKAASLPSHSVRGSA